MVEDETRKQLAAGSEDQGIPFRTSFDPFNMIIQQLGKLGDKLEKLDEKIDNKIDKLDAKIDAMRREVDAKIDVLHREMDAKIDVLHREMDAKIDALHREMDAKSDTLRREMDAKIDARVDGLHQDLHNTTRWIIGTIVAVAGVAVALASWLLR